MIRDYVAALAQTKIPLRVRIVLLLAAGGADVRHQEAGGKDLRGLLGLTHSRHLDEAIDWLLEKRMIERIPAAGRRAFAYKLRPPEDWLEPLWVDERHAALGRVNFVRAGRIVQEAAFSVPETGALGTFAPPVRGGRKKGLAPPFRGGRKTQPVAPQSGGRNRAPLFSLSPEDVTSLDGGGEGGSELALNVERLAKAFMAGSGISELKGAPARQIVDLARRANGNFQALLELAGDPAGPGRFVDRLKQMRELLDQPLPCAGVGKGSPPDTSRGRDRQQLESSIAGLEKAGEGESSEAVELRERLASLVL